MPQIYYSTKNLVAGTSTPPFTLPQGAMMLTVRRDPGDTTSADAINNPTNTTIDASPDGGLTWSTILVVGSQSATHRQAGEFGGAFTVGLIGGGTYRLTAGACGVAWAGVHDVGDEF
jgi:hypothetical protein